MCYWRGRRLLRFFREWSRHGKTFNLCEHFLGGQLCLVLPKAWILSLQGFAISSLLLSSLVTVTPYAIGSWSHSQPISGLPVKPTQLLAGPHSPAFYAL